VPLDRSAPVVLLVEDEPDTLYTFATLLGRAGFAVVTASHPAIALEHLDKQRPDLVVTDFMMPYMNGRAFVESLRRRADTARVPVIMMSAVAPGEGPWDAFLRKPVEFDALHAEVLELLKART
jgi:CheY-like chemotaxis protein